MTENFEAVVTKEIDTLNNHMMHYSGHINFWQREAINEGMPIILNNTSAIDERKDIAMDIWGALEDSQRTDFCLWAHFAHARGVLPKAVFSEILIETHRRGKVGSLLSWFPLNYRIEMFEGADPKHLMSESEYERFQALPSEVKIYRGGSGVTPNKLKYGMSWTTDLNLAAWFASRFDFKGNPLVIEGVVKKENIFGCFDYESEIIIRGGRVSKMKVIDLDIKKGAQDHMAERKKAA